MICSRDTITRSGLLLATTALLLLGACSSSGSGEDDRDPVTTTSTAPDAPDATEDETDDVGDEAGENREESPDGPGWAATAGGHRGEDGERFTYDCPADGEAHRIWGTELYTDDSSVCTAAVHVGLIAFEDGGEVEIEIAPGEDHYDGAFGNGVDSADWGSWNGSFFFPEAAPGTGTFEVSGVSWSKTANDLGIGIGESTEVVCSPGGEEHAIWGTDVYTGDSSVCTAAVHAGLIDLEDGGAVHVELRNGVDAYEGSTANGIESRSYGAWDPSFTFID